MPEARGGRYSPKTLAQRAHSSAWWPGAPMCSSWFQQRGHLGVSESLTKTFIPGI